MFCILDAVSQASSVALSFAGELAVGLRAHLVGIVKQQDQDTLSVLFVSVRHAQIGLRLHGTPDTCLLHEALLLI